MVLEGDSPASVFQQDYRHYIIEQVGRWIKCCGGSVKYQTVYTIISI